MAVFIVYSYVESASHLLYQIYCELVLPIPPVLEHLRSPESSANETSVALPSINAVMSYQSSSSDTSQTLTARDRPKYATVYFLVFLGRLFWVDLIKWIYVHSFVSRDFELGRNVGCERVNRQSHKGLILL